MRLLWWLSVEERQPIAGIEVWGTTRALRALREMVAGPRWTELQHLTGALPALQPPGTPPESHYGFRAHGFEHQGQALDEIWSEVEASAVHASLHDRVRELRDQLPERLPLVACLNVGHEPLSAALQTALSLQAGMTDRLIYVGLHPSLKLAIQENPELDRWAFPGPSWTEGSGVSESEQLRVYDVPFPRLRVLVSRRLPTVLADFRWDEVWPTLEANMSRDAKGVLRRTGIHSWVYEVWDAHTKEQLYASELTRRAGAVLAAMASATSDAAAADLVAWLDAHEVGWAPPSDAGHDPSTRNAALRGAVTALRRQLDDIPVGLERFSPAEMGFSIPHLEVHSDLP
ncbi:MAG: hypothetical protein AAGA48_19690 [Myxococcota bacterium]